MAGSDRSSTTAAMATKIKPMPTAKTKVKTINPRSTDLSAFKEREWVAVRFEYAGAATIYANLICQVF
jgi:hypothetical protein